MSKSPQTRKSNNNNLEFPIARDKHHLNGSISVVSGGSSANSANVHHKDHFSEALHLPNPNSRNPHNSILSPKK